MNKKYRMNICTALDDNYAKYACVMLGSLFINNPDAEVYVYLLQNSLSEESLRILGELCREYGNRIYSLSVDESKIDKRILTTDNWGVEAAFRLQMMELLPADVDRLLYLDSDMIINKSIKELYHSEMGEKELICAVDMPLAIEAWDVYTKTHTKIYEHLVNEKRYFNSGMIVFNVTVMREKYSLKSYMELAEKLDFQIFAPDQDLLNMMHQNSVILVDPWKYNFFAGIGIDHGYDYDMAKKEVSIIHFAGKKPWNGGDHIHHSIEKLWWDYALDTPYRDVFLKEYVLSTVEDGSMRDYVRGLLNEISGLKGELNSAIDSFKKLYAAFENRK